MVNFYECFKSTWEKCIFSIFMMYISIYIYSIYLRGVSWWWTGRPGVLQFIRSQSQTWSDWAELNWTLLIMLFSSSASTVNPLHTYLQVANFQRCKRVVHQCQAWVKLQLALCLLLLLLLMILQLYHLLPPLPPSLNNSSCLFTWCQYLYASCCTVPFMILYHKIKDILFFVLVFECVICMKTI